MSLRAHLKLLATATVVWLGFWIAGLPDYYAQYSATSLLVFEGLLLAPVAAAGWLALRGRRRTSRTRRAVAIAFHFTVPLFLYDLAYCGIHLGHGFGFVATYWWLTAYYVVPWVLFPATAAWLDRAEARAARASAMPAP
jgi:hypothetical protein